MLENPNTIIISNRTLYFGEKIPGEEKLSYSLPPKPPGGIDVRFTGDWKVCDDNCIIEITGAEDDLSVEFTIRPGELWELTNGETDKKYPLNGTGHISYLEVGESFTLKKTKTSLVPDTYALHQNYPNPFNPITTLRYDLPEQSQVTLTVYDLMGRELIQLVNEKQNAGYKSIRWDGTDKSGKPVSAGIYLYRLQAYRGGQSGEFVQTKKMVFLK